MASESVRDEEPLRATRVVARRVVATRVGARIVVARIVVATRGGATRVGVINQFAAKIESLLKEDSLYK